MLETNEEIIKEYLKDPGLCPLCGTSDVEGRQLEIDGETVWQRVVCNDCNAEWDDIYTLTGMDIIN